MLHDKKKKKEKERDREKINRGLFSNHAKESKRTIQSSMAWPGNKIKWIEIPVIQIAHRDH